MTEPWVRTFLAGAAAAFSLIGLASGTAALLSGKPQPGADLLAGSSGSVRSRGWRAMIMGVVWTAVVVLAGLVERPLWSQLAFWAALLVGFAIRGAYDRHHNPDGPEPLPPGAPRTSSDPVQLRSPADPNQGHPSDPSD
jgi:hypothetical protein